MVFCFNLQFANVEHIFIYWFAICVSSLVRCQFRSSVQFFLLFFKNFFVYFGQQSFIRCLLHIILPIRSLSSLSLNSIFGRTVLSFNKVRFVSYFMDHAFDVDFKSHHQTQSHLLFCLLLLGFHVIGLNYIYFGGRWNILCFTKDYVHWG